jgi:hypothetical protein
MNDKLRACLDAWLLRAEVAVKGGPSLDPGTEAAAARQALAALNEPLPDLRDPNLP